MRAKIWVVAAVCGVATSFAGADALAITDPLDSPLALSNRSPLVQIHGLPGARDGAVLAPAQTEMRIGFDVANNFVDESANGETLVLDGETRRAEFGARIGLGHGWEVGAMLPVLEQTGGNLDSSIEGWHKFWGLPDGGRPGMQRNQLNYRYQRNGITELDFQHVQSGIGDLQISAANQLWQNHHSQIALAATVKLPTGDADKLTGDGATTTDITLAASTQNLFGSGLRGYANAGVLWMQRGDVLSGEQNNVVYHGSAGLGWLVWDGLELKAQLDTHTAFYKSDLRALGSDAVTLTLGGSARLSSHWLLDIGVGEDLRVDTAPDVVLQFVLRRLD